MASRTAPLVPLSALLALIAVESHAKEPKRSKSGEHKVIQKEVGLRLKQWRAAWEETAKLKTVESLRAFYHPRFFKKDAKRNLDQQMKRFLAQAKAASKISVRVQGVGVTLPKKQEDRVTVRFMQTYKTGSYVEVGTKILAWTKHDGEWRIISEDFKQLLAQRYQENQDPLVKQVKARIREVKWTKLHEEVDGDVEVSEDGVQQVFGEASGGVAASCTFIRWQRLEKSVVQVHGVCMVESSNCSYPNEKPACRDPYAFETADECATRRERDRPDLVCRVVSTKKWKACWEVTMDATGAIWVSEGLRGADCASRK